MLSRFCFFLSCEQRQRGCVGIFASPPLDSVCFGQPISLRSTDGLTPPAVMITAKRNGEEVGVGFLQKESREEESESDILSASLFLRPSVPPPSKRDVRPPRPPTDFPRLLLLISIAIWRKQTVIHSLLNLLACHSLHCTARPLSYLFFSGTRVFSTAAVRRRRRHHHHRRPLRRRLEP